MGIGATAGGITILVDAEGMGLDPAWIEGSPFADYTVPGLFLLAVIGGGMLLTAGLALARSPLAPLAALGLGLILLTWLGIQSAILGYVGGAQVTLVAICGAHALALIAAALTALRGSLITA